MTDSIVLPKDCVKVVSDMRETKITFLGLTKEELIQLYQVINYYDPYRKYDNHSLY